MWAPEKKIVYGFLAKSIIIKKSKFLVHFSLVSLLFFFFCQVFGVKIINDTFFNLVKNGHQNCFAQGPRKRLSRHYLCK